MSNLNNLTSVVTYITYKFGYSGYQLGLIPVFHKRYLLLRLQRDRISLFYKQAINVKQNDVPPQ
ncbi:hypothetical protein A4S05_29155 [Nostoc sp. KVJ20]|uniref:hypothetical protein n=1 Tax=unclassified Nostoc TaxID=2593658 RepID=UPI00083E3EA7|nr:hypothetical protein [Nostoc sp. KVJ20]ODH01336.1 hypothetical protein A4S05_29155 [Nostoc sp. KVJ20]